MRDERLRVLALEPYYGGSHRAFLDGWSAGSRHDWTKLTLPPHHWKWRMRHGALAFAGEAARQIDRRGGEEGAGWDVIFATSMVDLGLFFGLAPPCIRQLPAVLYFHENQLTYPVALEDGRDGRDLHFAFTHLTSCLAARRLWFNSDFHRGDFLVALGTFARKMPDHRPVEVLDELGNRARVQHPGISDPAAGPDVREPGPLRLLWAARWEVDKAPETFFAALNRLREAGVDFRVSVLGESFRRVPEVFGRACEELVGQTDHWGFLPDRGAYEAALRRADVFVSTARHEFFGISAVEAMAAGARPMLPRRLAYPELVGRIGGAPELDVLEEFTFATEAEPAAEAQELARRLAQLAERLTAGTLWPGGDRWAARRAVEPLFWQRRIPELDEALSEAAAGEAPGVPYSG